MNFKMMCLENTDLLEGTGGQRDGSRWSRAIVQQNLSLLRARKGSILAGQHSQHQLQIRWDEGMATETRSQEVVRSFSHDFI